MSHPLFSQKHYEHIIGWLQKMPRCSEKIIVMDELCMIFENDNPKFKAELFRRLCAVNRTGEKNENGRALKE